MEIVDWIHERVAIGWLITITFYVLALINVFRVVRENRNPSSSLAWIVVNVAMPFVGVPLYYLLGENKMRRYIRRRKRSEVEGEVGEQVRLFMRKILEQPADQVPESLVEFTKYFSHLGAIYAPMPSDVQLLINGEVTFREIFTSIKRATKYICVQYYILRSDRLGEELRDLLIEKAQAGVAVFVLLDDLGSFGLGRSYIRALQKGGVKFARFLPLSWPFKFQINFRNHRKLVIVDGDEAFIGGLNVGTEYISRRESGFWRDTHFKVTGSVIFHLNQVFIDDWHFAAPQDLKLEPLRALQNRINTYNPYPGVRKCVTQVVPFGPADPVEVGVLLYLQVIQSAKHSLWIASPYFVPDAVLEKALEAAVLRGVDVRLMVPRRGDSRFVHGVTMIYLQELRRKGVQVYFYEKGFMHQKIVLVDHAFTVLGTSNFDNRSMYLNFETAMVVHSLAHAREVADMLKADFEECRSWRDEDFHWRGFSETVVRFARLLAPLL